MVESRSGTEAAGTHALPPPQHEAEEGVRHRREKLHGAMVDLEEALAGPKDDEDRWLGALRTAVERVHTTLEEHIVEAEGPDGLIPQILHDSPWLAPRAQGLVRDHVELLAASRELAAACDVTPEPELLREHAIELVAQIARHRHRSADVLYDAYELDLSAGD